MFKNALILKLAAPVSFEALTAGAERATFSACGPTQPLSIGFVPPREKNGAMVEAIGGHWTNSMRHSSHCATLHRSGLRKSSSIASGVKPSKPPSMS